MENNETERGRIVAPVRLRNMLWLPIIVGTFAASQIWGTPHLRVSYRWNGRDASPYYYDCRYWGISTFQIAPIDGQCPLILLAGKKRGIW